MLSLRYLVLFVAALVYRVSAWSEAWEEQYNDFQLGLRGHQHMPGQDTLEEAVDVDAVNVTGKGYFKQLIDHKDPSKGTFEQFYYWSNQWWQGPGSPVILFTPGEVNASSYSSYLTLNRTTGSWAEAMGAAIFVVEHRYWGTSSPYADLSTANLQYLTLENSILDFTNFANNIKLPWSDCPSTAKDVPWIYTGGSYSGALSAWTESVAPGTFWAYHSSSAPVEAISDYAAYFYPIQEGMAKNCSQDINLVIEYMDGVINSGNQSKIAELKTMFKMQDIKHDDDFMAAIENGPWLWQGNQFYTGYSPFFEFCDYVENASHNQTGNATVTTSADGVGLQRALQGYATWFSTSFLPNYCYKTYRYQEYNSTYNTMCFDTYNATSPLFTDRAVSNTMNRQWNWFLCNEPFGYWQDGAASDRPTLVSRLVNAQYWTRQCDLFFPKGPGGETYGIAKGKTEAVTNNYTKGWDQRMTSRLLYVTGGFDPWRESGVSASIRPGGPMKSSAQTPINVVPGGFHVSDMITKNGVVNAGVQAVINANLQQIQTWVAQWPKKPRRARTSL